MVYEFAYFNTRGISLPPRLMLAHYGETAEIKRHALSPLAKAGMTLPELGALMQKAEMGVIDGGEWFRVKNTLGLDYPTMPYLIDGDVRLTQSIAICVYIEQKHNSCPVAADVLGRAVMLCMLAKDWRDSFNQRVVMPMPKEQWEGSSAMFRQGMLPKHMKALDAILAKKTTKYLMTDAPLAADFLMFDYVELMMHFAKDVVEQYPNVVAYLATMEELDAVKKVREEEPRAFWPCSPVFCMWGTE